MISNIDASELSYAGFRFPLINSDLSSELFNTVNLLELVYWSSF